MTMFWMTISTIIGGFLVNNNKNSIFYDYYCLLWHKEKLNTYNLIYNDL